MTVQKLLLKGDSCVPDWTHQMLIPTFHTRSRLALFDDGSYSKHQNHLWLYDETSFSYIATISSLPLSFTKHLDSVQNVYDRTQ